MTGTDMPTFTGFHSLLLGLLHAPRAEYDTKQFIKSMCVHVEHISIDDHICIEFCMDKSYQHKSFGCDVKLYWCALMPKFNDAARGLL